MKTTAIPDNRQMSRTTIDLRLYVPLEKQHLFRDSAKEDFQRAAPSGRTNENGTDLRMIIAVTQRVFDSADEKRGRKGIRRRGRRRESR